MRSDMVKQGLQRAPHRSLLRATGVARERSDFDRPLIAVCNSYADIVPGHVHLQALGRIAKAAIRKAGGLPFEFNTIAICDGVAMGHEGMKFSLPSRELIADCVESMVEAHKFDAMLCMPNCDKIIPGMLMAAMRCNIPTIFVSGGPMAAGRLPDGRVADLVSVFQGIGAVKAGTLTEQQLQELEEHACPGCGSCSGMFTANSMNCLCEALGMALPGNGTCLAIDPKRKALVRRAARQLLRLLEADTKPRDIVTPEAIDNAFALDMAMGGSTNTVLHVLALANEAGVDYPLARLNDVAARVPHLCKVSPAPAAPGKVFHMEDVDAAGGVSAILKELSRKPGTLHTKSMTVSGKALGKNIARAADPDGDCIRRLDNAYSQRGGLAILFGNLAPAGAVIKAGAVDQAMMTHQGPAVIFESQEDACEGILAGKVTPGDVVVIRYEGPKGGPGMQEMLSPTAYITGMGLGDKCALITDGRFSGGTAGACVGHISPEAAEGGPIGLLRNGDIICLDVLNRRVDVRLSDEELQARRATWTPPPPRVTSRWLRRYAKLVTSAGTGAVLTT